MTFTRSHQLSPRSATFLSTTIEILSAVVYVCLRSTKWPGYHLSTTRPSRSYKLYLNLWHCSVSQTQYRWACCQLCTGLFLITLKSPNTLSLLCVLVTDTRSNRLRLVRRWHLCLFLRRLLDRCRTHLCDQLQRGHRHRALQLRRHRPRRRQLRRRQLQLILLRHRRHDLLFLRLPRQSHLEIDLRELLSLMHRVIPHRQHALLLIRPHIYLRRRSLTAMHRLSTCRFLASPSTQ